MGFPKAELSIVVTGDDEIRAINAEYRGKDKPTDVLSFSQIEGHDPAAGTGPVMLGDVIVSADTAARQAESAGYSFESEMVRLLIHGTLHLLGHDHVHGGLQARRMRAEERRLAALVEQAHGIAVEYDS